MSLTMVVPAAGGVAQPEPQQIRHVSNHCASAAGLTFDQLQAVQLPQMGSLSAGDRLLVGGVLEHWRTAALVAQAEAIGVQIWALSSFCPAAALELLMAQQITHSDWLPWQLAALLDESVQERARFVAPAHRQAWVGGARTPQRVKHQVISWWGPILHEHFCGLTWPGCCSVAADDWLDQPETVGYWREAGVDEAGATQLAALDEQDNSRLANQIGRLGIVGAGLNPQLTSECGYVDEQGRVVPLGLAANRLQIGFGRDEVALVAAGETEQWLETHVAVHEAALLAVNAEHAEAMGLATCFYAVVQPRDGSAEARPLLEIELLEFARRGVSEIKCPAGVLFVEQLPRLAGGKVDLAALGVLVARSLVVSPPDISPPDR